MSWWHLGEYSKNGRKNWRIRNKRSNPWDLIQQEYYANVFLKTTVLESSLKFTHNMLHWFNKWLISQTVKSLINNFYLVCFNVREHKNKKQLTKFKSSSNICIYFKFVMVCLLRRQLLFVCWFDKKDIYFDTDRLGTIFID